MKPARWTGGPRYVELQMPPICSWCSEDKNFVDIEGGLRNVGWKLRQKSEDMVLEYQKSLHVSSPSATGQTKQPIRVRQLPKWMSEAPASRVCNTSPAAAREKDPEISIPGLEGPLRLPIPIPLPAKLASQAVILRPLPKWMSKSTAYRITKSPTTASDRWQVMKIPDRKSSRGVLDAMVNCRKTVRKRPSRQAVSEKPSGGVKLREFLALEHSRSDLAKKFRLIN